MASSLELFLMNLLLITFSQLCWINSFVNGQFIGIILDEFVVNNFQSILLSIEGKLDMQRDNLMSKKEGFLPNMEFEQDHVQILDALMPLYLNNQILRTLQESLASELAARMNAMSNTTDNAIDLKKTLLNAYNRQRQCKITSEILEIVAGVEAFL
ncbi:ATP synthase gamma chain, chloroplastic-like [Cynara cardunculus var. scolymus]|uniref:ATP synthase gamma chain, chloroplastic-like n=1 Tax=Cynara cardunculus var. scolymus TaxID=59895 RepID=UPI000D623D70|nr:ATP synthase gamma chain, chloroplastic-like [Cynara cardunculus var. scolymus]